ncbi:MAG: hypothetical protein J0H24_04510, partial [Delftia acidovorans]|nr:hypothetical protein [Delftia acidovorans]
GFVPHEEPMPEGISARRRLNDCATLWVKRTWVPGSRKKGIKLSGEIALELRNPSGGAGMPGAMSDADRQFLQNMVPGLQTTPQGRTLMLDTAKRLAQRDIDVARLAREYRRRNGQIDEGFYEELARFSEANPLFSQKNQAGGGNGMKIRRVR